METLQASGYSAHLVGGCVRDSLMGRRPCDWDICTSALPQQVMDAFPGRKVLPTGIRHGTVTLVEEGGPLEITTLRRDGDYLNHRHPRTVEFTPSLEEDLARRDFTVNAMAYAPYEGVTDPFGGREDLKAGVLRCVGNSLQRFDEDALRILRLFRFASQLSFEPEPQTLAAAAQLAPLLQEVSGERISAELNKLLLGENVFRALCLAADHGVLEAIIPEMAPCIGFDQHKTHHIHPVDRHLFAAVAAAPPRLEIRLALLLHDIGKPRVFQLDEKGGGHCPDHAAVSADYAGVMLRRLRYPKNLAGRVTQLVSRHIVKLPADKAALRRLCAQMGTGAVGDLIAVRRADNLAKAPSRAFKWDAVATMLDEIIAAGDPLRIEDLAVGGQDLLELGVPGGPIIGEMLGSLLELVVEHPEANRRETLLQEAQRLQNSGAAGNP